MARCRSNNVGELTVYLSSLSDFLYGVNRLRTLLLQSSPSYLVSEPEQLISLIEVAKNTLIKSGVRLHVFSSCPERLRPYKAAYFGLLTQLQAHSHNARLDSKELQVRLNRLLFPLATQLKRNSDASDDITTSEWSCISPGVNSSRRGVQAPLEVAQYVSGSEDWVSSSPTLNTCPRQASKLTFPPDVMLPPPVPFRRGTRGTLLLSADVDSEESPSPTATQLESLRPTAREHRSARPIRRHTSRDTLHFKRRNPEAELPNDSYTISHLDSKVIDEPDNSTILFVDKEPDASEPDEELSSAPIIIPARSPLRRTFGIFCTGKGMGAFSGSGNNYRHRHDRSHKQFSSSLEKSIRA